MSTKAKTTAKKPGTAHFKMTLEVVGTETDTLTWENKALPLPAVAARQSILLGAFAAATARQASGQSIV